MSHLPIPRQHAAHPIRRCNRVGGAIIAIAPALAAMNTIAGLLAGGALGAITISSGITGAGLALLSGLILRNATTHLRGPYVNEPRARTVRRVLAFLCVATALCYTGLLVAAFAIGVTATAFPLLLLNTFPTALAATAAITSTQVLRRPGPDR